MMKFLNNICSVCVVVGLILIGFQAINVDAKDPNRIILTDKNTIAIRGPIDQPSMKMAMRQFIEVVAKRKKGDPVYIVLNTPGGEVQTGLEFIDGIRGSGVKVHTITQFAASMGFQTVQQLGDRLILPSGILMSHRARGGVEGEFGGINPGQLDNRLAVFKQTILEMDMHTVERTKGKQTYQSYITAYENELWLTAQQAVDGGYADRIVTAVCDNSLTGSSHSKVELLPGLTLEIELPNCPVMGGIEGSKLVVLTSRGEMDIRAFKQTGGVLDGSCSFFSQKLCLINTSLSYEKIEELQTKALRPYRAKYGDISL